MNPSHSVAFFERQFQRQLREQAQALNPFEEAALPWLQGRVLDYGCGLGELSLAAARRGCEVLALDASATAIAHLRQIAQDEGLAIDAREAELSAYQLSADFDTVVCIGLLMFMDCDSALHQLTQLQQRLRPGGVLVLNVLVEGTNYMEMFDPQRHCLLTAQQLRERFAGWTLEQFEQRDFPAPGDTVKSFVTLIARKPAA
ncbi:MAG: class I SAM-dependent methyltransferase [Hylemonella sp.]|uniref:class I SAM-dependent methyltransferase n=1 Tax=Hylemonella sp. TaxID=2066020 RepID=UPI0022C0BDD9|nr:class I SAM-dependent methyltransferase [Hylemonella sp.]MCZ8253153.1 class I SAM-dependent methyltransferase [Hylemonella sp.]